MTHQNLPGATPFFKQLAIAQVLFPLCTTRFLVLHYYYSLDTLAFVHALPFLVLFSKATM
jgi:hypothetical protein